MSATEDHPRISDDESKRSRTRWIFAVLVICLLLLYVGSYFHLSRRGMAEAAAMGADGFLYMSMKDADCDA